MMKIDRRIFIKWTLVVLFCGGNSFFWGYGADASIAAMLLGMLTIILGFSLIESHPRYKAKRQGSTTLSKALDWGLRIRVLLTVYILAIYGLAAAEISDFEILGFPLVGELFIGAAATGIANDLTNASIGNVHMKPTRNIELTTEKSEVAHFMASYIATILTSLTHTVILLVICGLVYMTLSVRSRFKRAPA